MTLVPHNPLEQIVMYVLEYYTWYVVSQKNLVGLLVRLYPEWRSTGYQRELSIAMLPENEAKEDKQKVVGKHQGRLRTTEYAM